MHLGTSTAMKYIGACTAIKSIQPCTAAFQAAGRTGPVLCLLREAP